MDREAGEGGAPATPNLKALRDRVGLNQAEIAEALGVTKSTYSRIERGEIELRHSQITVLKRIFGVSADEIVGDAAVTVPIHADVSRSFPVHELRDGCLTDTGRRIKIDVPLSLRAFAVDVRDEAMRGKIDMRDIVLIEPSIEPSPGRIVIAREPRTGAYAIGYYSPLRASDPRAPGWVLSAHNRAYPEVISTRDAPGEVVGVATWRIADLSR